MEGFFFSCARSGYFVIKVKVKLGVSGNEGEVLVNMVTVKLCVPCHED